VASLKGLVEEPLVAFLKASDDPEALDSVAAELESVEALKHADICVVRMYEWLVVDYGRPLLRGRADIFGSGADYGKTIKDGSPVWRAGANDTTRLTTQAPLQLGGKTLPPGVYNLFIDLKPGNWALVLNTQPVQEKYDPNEKVKLYGSYNYDSKFDVMRVPMTVKTADSSVEQLTIGFVNVTASRATLSIAWDKTVATVDLTLAAAK